MKQTFETKIAFRFGYGYAPRQAPISDAANLLAQVTEPDKELARFHGPDYPTRVELMKSFLKYKRAVKKGEESAKPLFRQAQRNLNHLTEADLANMFSRSVFSPQSFRERLVFFWADHFTVIPKNRLARAIWGTFQESAIRPNTSGKFADLLIAATTHPSMVLFLDQDRSTGPNSKHATSKKKRRLSGLNENLAREILELHTLGVLGGYTQTDVRQLAELLTGLSTNDTGRIFRKGQSEPGEKMVLGKVYGGGTGTMDDIETFLRDVAIHPNTAAHIARKLVVHFVSDDPDPMLVDHLTTVFLDTDGDLFAMYKAMLDHPAAWVDLGQKAKQPYDFMVSSVRALGLTAQDMSKMNVRRKRAFFAKPIGRMGQPILKAPGPNGWPEEVASWITPHGVAARLNWALAVTQQLGADLDPRDFVTSTLQELAGETLQFAVAGAEQRNEGLALVLISPEFNRR